MHTKKELRKQDSIVGDSSGRSYGKVMVINWQKVLVTGSPKF